MKIKVFMTLYRQVRCATVICSNLVITHNIREIKPLIHSLYDFEIQIIIQILKEVLNYLIIYFFLYNLFK